MKKYAKHIFIFGLLALAFFYFLFENKTSEAPVVSLISPPSAIGTPEDPQKRFNFEIRQLIDPATGFIPDNVHKKEAEFVKSIPTKEEYNTKGQFRTKALSWALAGPSNVGGRTRAVALDALDEKVIVAGGVSGGMWRSENGGISWAKSSHPNVINSASCVVQDPRPGKENIWYHGTGELKGNSPRAVGAPYRGDGIFKSTDGARTWDLLPSTSDGLLTQFNSAFNYVWNMAINPTTNADEVYAAVYGGIIRTQDGGATWETVLGADLINPPQGTDLNESGASFYTNIMITPSGVMYAHLSEYTSLDNVTTGKGVFRSTDGTNWTRISPSNFASLHQRIVMSYAPSNESIVYFAVQANDLEIWKYNDQNSTWLNKSINFPEFEEERGNFDSQDNYNFMVAVHPSDENIVYLGGTNLYRSSDGFSSSDNVDWIGGYDPKGNVLSYEGHHPDQHALVFYPSDPDKMISANDGGLMITNNNRSEEPSWAVLNNGYVTSQFYSISLSKQEGDAAIIGGMQDNGTYLKTAPGENQPWSNVFGGDGSFAHTTPDNLFWYASFQESQIYRLTLNNSNELTSFARVDPVDGKNYLFINPYVLDPNNYNRMYLAGGERIWRNNNLSQIPGGSQEPTNVNWDRLAVNAHNSSVSALDISTLPENILYAGTSEGEVLKVTNANAGSGEVSSIFNTGGYVVNVSIDPSDADNVLVLNSNYNVPSIFYTSDGGDTFTDVGGNLEEFTNGEGNGPSTRWSEIVPMADGGYTYFVGTSSGLYSTTELDGNNTIWLQEGASTIGRSVVRMMDYRSSDGKIVTATHGNGVFDSTIESTLPIETSIDNIQNLVVTNAFPNPFSDHIDIEFKIPEQGSLSVRILNSLGQNIKTILNYPQYAGTVSVRWDGTNTIGEPVKDGMYFYRIYYNGQVTGGTLLYDQQ